MQWICSVSQHVIKNIDYICFKDVTLSMVQLKNGVLLCCFCNEIVFLFLMTI